MKLDRRLVVVSVLVLVAGVIPLYAGGSMLYERYAYRDGWPATGRVVDAERLWLRELATPKRNVWFITYEFKIATGEVRRGSGTYAQHRTMKDLAAGSEVRVLYLPDNPSSSSPADAYKIWDGLIYLALGAGLWSVAGILIWLEVRGHSP